MHVGGGSDSPQSAISYAAARELFPGVTSPSDVFSELTGLFGGGTAMSPDEYRVLRGKKLVDLVKDDLETLERFDMSASDRRKLEAWKELLRQTGDGVAALAQCNEQTALALGLGDENFPQNTGLSADITAQVVADLDGADLYANTAVLAVLCDQSRVVFLKYPASYIFRGLGIALDNDSIAHRTGDASIGGQCLPGVNDMILTIDRYYAVKFAHLVGSLDSFEEGDGTVLDNTATVWFQQHLDGAAFNMNNMPILQAGSCAGYFRTGVAVNVDDGSADLDRGNSEAPCAAEGAEIGFDEFGITGTPVEIANAPINKYYCNLMNAIGVKAGEDGFPLPGGSEEVTHYGMYDDTRDFASGGENPPKINDPGGFEELEA